MINRITKKNRFEDIIALLNGQPTPYGTNVNDAIDFVNHEIELLSKRNSSSGARKPTANQLQNEVYKGMIVDYLAGVDKPVTCEHIRRNVPDFYEFTPQKVSNLLSGLRKEGRVVSEKIKGTSHFQLS